MTSTAFTFLFATALAASVAARLWLARRQIVHVEAHRETVPDAFTARIGADAHRKAADYTVAKQRVAIAHTLVDAFLLAALTLGGGVAMVIALTETMGVGPMPRDLLLFAAVGLLGAAVNLPFSWWHTFRIEARFGFNRMSFPFWVADLAKGTFLALLLGVPLLSLILWLMEASGPNWWLLAWAAWMGFQLLLLVLYPSVIAPLFNKFTPLPDSPVRERVEALLARCGFRNAGLYVMDGSKRSGHGNAYFTGFGRTKRIVFFDTLIERLAPDEIEAVLAHELGHYKLRHIAKRIAWSAGLSLLILALLAWLAREPWFYAGLGIPPDLLPVALARPGVALLLFMLALPVFTMILEPLGAFYSRRHEFEADAFATRHVSVAALTQALVKLYEDNATTLTPDPLHSAFYDSHPPAAVRVAHLLALPAAAPAHAVPAHQNFAP